MARIRTIKPEIWTDPEFIELSEYARLLFIASWNFATDYGVIHNKPRQIRMQCLPADLVDIDALIEECVSRRFYIPCLAPNGDAVLVIRTFTKNQKINRATEGRWGNPAKWPNPPETQLSALGLSESHPSEGKGRDNTDNSDRGSESVSDDAFGPLADLLELPARQLTRDERNHAMITNGASQRIITPTTHPL
jgi:hypothetical protein